LIVAAIVLSTNRSSLGDPRWSARWHPVFPDGEGMLYAWTLPALGVVWSFARLWMVPREEPLGGKRLFWAWVRTSVGVSFVLMIVGDRVQEFNVTDVGGLNGLFLWFVLGLFMALVLSVVLSSRRAGFSSTRLGVAAGTIVVLVVGVGFYRADLPDDGLSGLHGAARAKALVDRLNLAPDEFERARKDRARTAGLGYTVAASGERVDLEVAVPWPISGAAEGERLLEFWNRPGREIVGIPRPPWQAEWRGAASSADPPALVFFIRQPADLWEPFVLSRASGEAEQIAQAPWGELRAITTTLLSEHYLPPATAPVPQTAPEFTQIALLRVAVQTDELAVKCSTARLLTGGSAGDEFRAVAARARELRARILASQALPPPSDLQKFSERLTDVAVNNQWTRRADGCDAVDTTAEARLSNRSDEIRAAANTGLR
jgi:hypothetical protein